MDPVTDRADPIVIDSIPSDCGTMQLLRIHHRDWPEVHAEGKSVDEAARNLILQFEKNVDSSIDRWQKKRFEAAMRDVLSFEKSHPAGRDVGQPET
jgi:hypothetical protein